MEYLKALKVLTPREIEVLERIAAGHTSTEISNNLNISARTVQKHCEVISKKLHITGYRGLFHWCESHISST